MNQPIVYNTTRNRSIGMNCDNDVTQTTGRAAKRMHHMTGTMVCRQGKRTSQLPTQAAVMQQLALRSKKIIQLMVVKRCDGTRGISQFNN